MFSSHYFFSKIYIILLRWEKELYTDNIKNFRSFELF